MLVSSWVIEVTLSDRLHKNNLIVHVFDDVFVTVQCNSVIDIASRFT